MKRILLFILFSLSVTMPQAFAQNVEMAEGLRSSGKIYVVVGVLCIIFIAIAGYLIHLDSKLNKLKKEVEQLKK